MKKKSLTLIELIVVLVVLFFGCHSSPQLSESGQILSRLFEIADQLELEKAKLEGVYERQQKTITFNRQIVQIEEEILKKYKGMLSDSLFLIGGGKYDVEKITVDLSQRQEEVKQLQGQAAKSRERIDNQLNRLEAQSKLVASAKGNLELAGKKEEISLAELQALLIFEAVTSALKASSAKKSADRLAEALKAFQNLLDQAKAVPDDLEAMEAFDAGLLLTERNPLIPNSRWTEYLAAKAAEEEWRQPGEDSRQSHTHKFRRIPDPTASFFDKMMGKDWVIIILIAIMVLAIAGILVVRHKYYLDQAPKAADKLLELRQVLNRRDKEHEIAAMLASSASVKLSVPPVPSWNLKLVDPLNGAGTLTFPKEPVASWARMPVDMERMTADTLQLSRDLFGVPNQKPVEFGGQKLNAYHYDWRWDGIRMT